MCLKGSGPRVQGRSKWEFAVCRAREASIFLSLLGAKWGLEVKDLNWNSSSPTICVTVGKVPFPLQASVYVSQLWGSRWAKLDLSEPILALGMVTEP